MNTPDPAPKPLDPDTIPPKLQRPRALTKELAELKAERDQWAKTALALSLAEVKKPGPKPAE